MSTSTTPKNIEAIPYRWFNTTRTLNGDKKQGGKVAVMHANTPGFADVLVYEPDHEDWWRVVPSDVVIRAAIRGPAQNGSDLIAWALPLANQPTETQQRIKERIPELNIMTDTKPEVPQESSAIEVDKVVDNSRSELVKQQARRLQRLILQGEWLENNEQQLKVIQSTVSHAMSEWYEDDSEDCHANALCQMQDALMLLVDVIRDLRYNCHCPDEQREGILYYHGFRGAVTEVIDLNKEFVK
jgi:hypothetical protein